MADQRAPRAEQVRELFDAKAPTWSAKYADDGRLAGRLTRLLRAVHAHVPVGSRVLDLGCGTGELSCALAAVGMLVTACDISAEMLSRTAGREAAGQVEWIQLDSRWCTLPFDSATFDAVVASSVLEYADDPAAVIAECARVLGPGGVLLCTVPNPIHPVRWLEWLLGVTLRSRLARVADGRWPRFQSYITYLQISRHRRSAAWWCAVAAKAGLAAIQDLADMPRYSPLCLLAFGRPEEMTRQ